jgi:hypothetical protein
MTMAPVHKLMPELPRPGQKVCWRDPGSVQASGWEEVFGPGPFEVVRMVDKSDRGLAAGLILRTKMGEWEIPEVWLAIADGEGTGPGGPTIQDSLSVAVLKGTARPASGASPPPAKTCKTRFSARPGSGHIAAVLKRENR